MDTTNSQNFFGCPCFPDYLQIGADQYGFYITADEYNAFSPFFVDATILAISKTSLAAGAVSPTAVQFTLPFATGYEFAIQPATTPPGASNFVASGGVEFFVSSQARFSIDNSLAVWAMTNTSTLLISNPNMQLIRINIPTQTSSYPDVANQKPGPLPYGDRKRTRLPSTTRFRAKTSTLLIANPNMQLIRSNIPTQTESYPEGANQKPGPLP